MTEKEEAKTAKNPTVLPCFWISWFQPTDDYRPLTYPPNEKIIGWWCTGQRCNDSAFTLVAMVKADSEKCAKKAIVKDWPEAKEWRFCEQKIDRTLGDRFPLSDWMMPRLQDA